MLHFHFSEICLELFALVTYYVIYLGEILVCTQEVCAFRLYRALIKYVVSSQGNWSEVASSYNFGWHSLMAKVIVHFSPGGY